MKPTRVNPTAEADLLLRSLKMRPANSPHSEPLNRSSRGDEALIAICARSLSLLTSAATNGGFMGKGCAGHLARIPSRAALSQVGSDTVILPQKNDVQDRRIRKHRPELDADTLELSGFGVSSTLDIRNSAFADILPTVCRRQRRVSCRRRWWCGGWARNRKSVLDERHKWQHYQS